MERGWEGGHDCVKKPVKRLELALSASCVSLTLSENSVQQHTWNERKRNRQACAVSNSLVQNIKALHTSIESLDSRW